MKSKCIIRVRYNINYQISNLSTKLVFKVNNITVVVQNKQCNYASDGLSALYAESIVGVVLSA